VPLQLKGKIVKVSRHVNDREDLTSREG